MQLISLRSVTIVAVASMFALGAENEGGGCDCNLCDDFRGTVRKEQLVDSTDRQIDERFQVDPNENEDLAKHRSKIRNGNVAGITLHVLDLGAANQAATIRGQVRVRPVGTGEEAWITIVRDWNDVPLSTGNRYQLELDQGQVRAFNELVFGAGAGALEAQILGEADVAPVQFRFEITLELEFKGCV